jgi:hypothetical protein
MTYIPPSYITIEGLKQYDDVAHLKLIADGVIKGEEAELILLRIFPSTGLHWEVFDIQDFLKGVYQLAPIEVDRLIDQLPLYETFTKKLKMSNTRDPFGAIHVDGAMDTLKTNVILGENIFYLADGLPTEDHTDKHGKILCFHEETGWQVFPLEKARRSSEHGYIAWTFTPENPPALTIS